MVDQLSSFAAEVTRVAREVGTEGKLGGQAEVEGVSGTWKKLTENVNQLASTLTTQLRAIAEVSTAVTRGDLTRQVAVEASRRGRRAQGQHQPDDRQPARDHAGQRGAGLAEDQPGPHHRPGAGPARPDGRHRRRSCASSPRRSPRSTAPSSWPRAEGDDAELRLVATYGYKARKTVSNRFKVGRGAGRPGRPRAQADPDHAGARRTTSRSPPGSARPRRSTSSCCRCSSRTRCSASSSWRR